MSYVFKNEGTEKDSEDKKPGQSNFSRIFGNTESSISMEEGKEQSAFCNTIYQDPLGMSSNSIGPNFFGNIKNNLASTKTVPKDINVKAKPY